MLYVNVSATGLYQNDEFTQYYSHMISFTVTVNGVQKVRDGLDAIDCAYSERDHVTVILCKFVVLIKAGSRNVNIEHKKQIFVK